MSESLEFQILWHHASIDLVEAGSIGSSLSYLTNGADHSDDPVATMVYRIVERAHQFDVFEESDLLVSVDDVHAVLDVVYRRVHQRAFELASLRGWVRIHAATIDLPGVRVLLTAPSGTGKTTVSCALRLRGVEVPADESALVRSGVAMPVPRRFHIKPAMRTVLPEVADRVAAAPSLADGSVVALDPRRLGGEWHIAARPIGAFVVLERSTTTELRRMPTIDAMPTLVEGCFRNQESAGAALHELAVVGREAPFFRLRLSDPRDAAEALMELEGELADATFGD